ncbi:MAG: DASS family sodium-coupled anion symporter [Akkermansiaceae bacterium]|nr:DASS family sodium-coupled anion symporter [Akkermansiaceae bacterium]MDP4648159.1 DASS family sodium-coupled anion symporter [Akkermansiaceae bacterium]MDP4778912.1 DASS family sodium-coupled anion symporter [Akkermansiaceae bacterium]MDP4846886.1 DASS family sodium-coupled anion symporter [Akkermansiaceae bacterium]
MKLALSLALLLSIAFLLPLPESAAMAGLDPQKVRLGLAFFACIACLWMTEALPLAITALLVPVLGAAMGLTEIKDSLASFSNPLIFLFFGGFALAAALSAQGLDSWIADRLAILGKGKFIPVALWLFLGTAILSMWISNTATTAMMIPLTLGILNRFNDSDASITTSNSRFLLLGLAYSASIGGLGTIVGSPPNGIAAKQLGIGFTEWMAFGVPAVALLLPAMVALLWLILKPTSPVIGEIPSLADGESKTGRFSFDLPRKITLAIFALTALAWIFSAKLGPLLGISDTDTWIALAAVALLALTKTVTWQQIDRGTDWGVLLLFGGGLALSGILSTSGASLFMARLLGATMQAWPFWLIIAAVVAFVIFLTELSSNTASAALLVPIFYTMAQESSLAPAQLVLPLALAASCAFMLPVGTPPNAIVFATGRIPLPAMMRTGLALNLSFILLITALALMLF